MPALVNPARGQAALEIGGRERALTVDYNTIARIEVGLDIELVYDPENAEAKALVERRLRSVNGIRVSVAAALSTERREVTAEQVGEWLSAEPGKLAEAAAAMTQAMNRFFEALSAAEKSGAKKEGMGTVASPAAP